MAGIFPQERSMAQRIFENIIFIEEVFAERAEGEIPDTPILELAKSFELARLPSGRKVIVRDTDSRLIRDALSFG